MGLINYPVIAKHCVVACDNPVIEPQTIIPSLRATQGGV